jgi:ribonuclease HII
MTKKDTCENCDTEGSKQWMYQLIDKRNRLWSLFYGIVFTFAMSLSLFVLHNHMQDDINIVQAEIDAHKELVEAQARLAECRMYIDNLHDYEMWNQNSEIDESVVEEQ